MRKTFTALLLAITALGLQACSISRPTMPQGIFPKEFPKVPPPDASAAWVPPGYKAEIAVKDLIYPTAVEFDNAGNMYVTEAGFAYGDLYAPARILRISPQGAIQIVAEQLNGPVTDIMWHNGRLYISHLGKISALEANGAITDLVTDLPVSGDHQNNQMSIGPDGKLYFGVGTATNSGIVGLDNGYPYVWLLLHPDAHDVPAKDIRLTGESILSPHPNNVMARQGSLISFWSNLKSMVASLFTRDPETSLLVRTGAFQPFGSNEDRIKGQVRSSGTILRMNTDGSNLEVYAWGLRNPFGVRWGPDGRLYSSDNAYDERGPRPIANAEDNIWTVKQDGWYGWPDYASGIPVTDDRFRSDRGPDLEFLMEDHPPVEKPLFTRPKHGGVTKFDFSRSADFGFQGSMFLGEVGGAPPVTTPAVESGHMVARIDLATGEATPFFRTKPEALGPNGPFKYVATPGPKRPVDVRFSPDGKSLYVVDIGGLTGSLAGAGPFVKVYPGSGVVWRITKEGAAPTGPPGNLSPIPPRAFSPPPQHGR